LHRVRHTRNYIALPNHRLELTAALRENVRPRSSAWALDAPKANGKYMMKAIEKANIDW